MSPCEKWDWRHGDAGTLAVATSISELPSVLTWVSASPLWQANPSAGKGTRSDASQSVPPVLRLTFHTPCLIAQKLRCAGHSEGECPCPWGTCGLVYEKGSGKSTSGPGAVQCEGQGAPPAGRSGKDSRTMWVGSRLGVRAS